MADPYDLKGMLPRSLVASSPVMQGVLARAADVGDTASVTAISMERQLCGLVRQRQPHTPEDTKRGEEVLHFAPRGRGAGTIQSGILTALGSEDLEMTARGLKDVDQGGLTNSITADDKMKSRVGVVTFPIRRYIMRVWASANSSIPEPKPDPANPAAPAVRQPQVATLTVQGRVLGEGRDGESAHADALAGERYFAPDLNGRSVFPSGALRFAFAAGIADPQGTTASQRDALAAEGIHMSAVTPSVGAPDSGGALMGAYGLVPRTHLNAAVGAAAAAAAPPPPPSFCELLEAVEVVLERPQSEAQRFFLGREDAVEASGGAGAHGVSLRVPAPAGSTLRVLLHRPKHMHLVTLSAAFCRVLVGLMPEEGAGDGKRGDAAIGVSDAAPFCRGREAERGEVMEAFYLYCRRNGLIKEKDEGRAGLPGAEGAAQTPGKKVGSQPMGIVVCNEPLKALIKRSKFKWEHSQLLLAKHIRPAPPVELSVRVPGPSNAADAHVVEEHRAAVLDLYTAVRDDSEGKDVGAAAIGALRVFDEATKEMEAPRRSFSHIGAHYDRGAAGAAGQRRGRGVELVPGQMAELLLVADGASRRAKRLRAVSEKARAHLSTRRAARAARPRGATPCTLSRSGPAPVASGDREAAASLAMRVDEEARGAVAALRTADAAFSSILAWREAASELIGGKDA